MEKRNKHIKSGLIAVSVISTAAIVAGSAAAYVVITNKQKTISETNKKINVMTTEINDLKDKANVVANLEDQYKSELKDKKDLEQYKRDYNRLKNTLSDILNPHEGSDTSELTIPEIIQRVTSLQHSQ